MDLTIRKEEVKDFDKIYALIEESFKTAEHSDGDEHNLVNRLRNSTSYIPELSLVVEIDNTIVGYIMFTKCFIKDNKTEHESLALAPLAISPKYQKLGIGKSLIKVGLEKAKALGFSSAIVLGHESYYPKFGFNEAKYYNIKAPFEVPSENFMVIELKKNSLKNISGTVIYAKEFFEI